MERSAEALPILEKDLTAFNQRAEGLISKAAYAARAPVVQAKTPNAGERAWMPSPSTAGVIVKETSTFMVAHKIPDARIVLEDKVNHAVGAVFQGLRIGLHVSKLYERASNLEALIDQNRRGVLPADHQMEFREKHYTASAIAMFAAAYYVAWELSRSDSADSRAVVEGVPEVNVLNPVDAFNCMMYYYGANLERPEMVQTADDFVRVTRLYFKLVADEIVSRSESLKYTEAFTSRTYKLEKSEFAITGFKAEMGAALATVEFNRVELAEVVGNRAAKRQAKLLAQRLMCYDFATRSNPMHKLGGLPKLRMGDGPPGTGKSMLIAAIATLLSDYCKALKYPFAFRPLPDNIISTFQGGSAEKGVEWFVGFQDPTKILYGTIDDGEVVLEDRTRHNVSGGVREFIGVFLRRTEGAYAINHGNFTIDIFTNLPDQIDKAVLSRIVSRFLIAGAQTSHDFADQDYLWWQKYASMAPAFVDMEEDPAYEFMLEQKMLASLAAAYVKYDEPKDERLRAIYRRVREHRDPRQHAFFGELFAAVRADFPFFTSRDVRNIQTAVDGRILDFELPDEWLEHPDRFYFLSFDQKREMLVELTKGNMKGLKFWEVKLQETIMYLDEMVRIAEVTRARTIDEGVRQTIMNLEIQARLKSLEKAGKLAYIDQVAAKIGAA